MSRVRYVVPVLIAGLIGAVWVGTAFCQQGGPPGGAPGQGGRGGWDPERMRQMMMERVKQTMGATDEEWTALQPRIEKVLSLQRQARGGFGMGRMFGRGGRAGAPEAPAAGAELSETEKASQALQAVVDNKDSKPQEITQALTAYREAREKAKQELSKAQEELRGVLTPRQEAQLVLLGLLD